MAEETLLSWADKQPSWTRDALRRHAISGGCLTAEDKTEILARVRHHGGMTADPAPVCVHLDASHLGNMPASGEEVTLLSLGPVENLNRLAEGQKMQFALNGVTIIYGDNGSGKSGYARIAKKLCRSITSAELLGNVFDKEKKPPARIKVCFRTPDKGGGAEDHEVDWTDGTNPPVEIADIAVFDSANARFYVDKENRVSFLPRDIALLQSHVDHCGEMDKIFDGEMKLLDKRIKIPLPAGYTPGGAIALMLAKLEIKSKQSLPTVEDIKNVAAWTETDANTLKELETKLAADPIIIAARCRRAKDVLEGYKTQIICIDDHLSTDVAKRFEGLRSKERLTAEAARLAAADQFADMPLGGVGQSAWRLMYDHAKSYALTLNAGTEKLPDAEGDRCPLCQEPLSTEAAKRMHGFNNFITGEATKSADAARTASENAMRDIKAVAIQAAKLVDQALAEYSGLSNDRKTKAAALASFFAAAAVRRDALLKANAPEEFQAIPALPVSPLQTITDEIATLEVEASNLDKASKKDDGRKDQRTLIDQLRDRKKLSEELATILARRDDLEQYAKLKKCREEVKSDLVSRKITDMRRSSVMKALEQSILDEIKALDLTHIPFQVQDRSDEGKSLFGVVLDAPIAVANNKVLSEGEQRALALACFLGEAKSHTAKHGFIIDDPVSSLDHIRLRKVAERLVAEAGTGRQVIIFTHNIHFYNEVVGAAARAEPQVPLLENFIRASGDETFGLISEINKPWIIMKVKNRLTVLRDRLKSYQGITDFKTDDWRSKATQFYADLRETWERLVEEMLFGETVERFRAEVKTQSLKGVTVDDEDYKEIFHAMKRVSERSGHDMAGGRHLPTPTLDEMKADLDILDKYRLALKTKLEETGERRKKLEQPPAAEVA